MHLSVSCEGADQTAHPLCLLPTEGNWTGSEPSEVVTAPSLDSSVQEICTVCRCTCIEGFLFEMISLISALKHMMLCPIVVSCLDCCPFADGARVCMYSMWRSGSVFEKCWS